MFITKKNHDMIVNEMSKEISKMLRKNLTQMNKIEELNRRKENLRRIIFLFLKKHLFFFEYKWYLYELRDAWFEDKYKMWTYNYSMVSLVSVDMLKECIVYEKHNLEAEEIPQEVLDYFDLELVEE